MAKSWTAWSPEAAAAEDKAQRSDSGGGVEYVKLKEGRNVLRLLPPTVGSDSPFHRVWQHYINTDDGKLVVFECPWRGKHGSERERCPACEEAERLDRSTNPLDKERARRLWPSRRVYANAIDRADPDAGTKVLVVGKMIYEGLLNIARDPDAGGDFTHPETGFDVIVSRTGTGMDTRYKVTAARSNSPLSEDDAEADEWLDTMHTLKDSVRGLTFDEIKAVATGEPVENARSSQKALPSAAKRGSKAQDDALDAEWDD